jgi:NAD(P)-dependent dehydrogenase (short-subunit alcohol dehydrogenase family)
MKIVVITGSTRGIGYGLAEEFLKRGHAVAISGRSQGSVDRAVEKLAAGYGSDRIHGQPCDVTSIEQVETLWDSTFRRFGRLDIWINNAGLGNKYRPAWEQDLSQMEAIVKTNLLGAMFGTSIAYRRMVEQGHGQIYIMEGFGSDGRMRKGLTFYGSSKAGLDYFAWSWVNEMPDDSPVIVGSLSPGMVTTDLLTDAYDDPEAFKQSQKIFNIIGDKVETVTPWLVERILENDKNGAKIKWLTRSKVLWRFATAAFNKRDLFADEA